MSSRIPLITASSLGGLAKLLRAEVGKSALGRALSDAGLRPNSPLQEGYFVPEASVIKFLGSAAHQTGDPLLGLRLGVRRNIGTQPALWGHYVTEAATLGKCFKRLERAMVCFCNYPGISLDATGDRAWLRYRFLMSGHEEYVQTGMGFVASIINIFRYYTGPDWFPDVIEIDAPPPAAHSALEEILPTEIHYDAERISFGFPRELLALPRQTELPLGHTTFSEVLRARVHRPPKSFESIVEEIIHMQIRSGSVDIDAAARSLDLSVRTVQRRLERTGLHFRDITEHVRMGVAREKVMQTDQTLSAVAKSVGYTNQFNFSRAFRRYFGKPPSKVRKASKTEIGFCAR